MRTVCASRRALNFWIAAALLAGCGGSQPPIGAPGTLPPSTAYTQKSWAQSASRPGTTVHYVYVANDGSADVSAFAINASSGALTQVKGSPFSAAPEPWGIAVDPTGKFAYVMHVTFPSDSGSVSAYAINARSGALTQVKGSPFTSGGLEPWEMTIGPAGKFAYVTNFDSDNVSAYAIDANSGALTQVQGSPFAASSGSFGVAIDPAGRFLYVVNEHSDNVSAYHINQSSGVLTQVQGSPFAAGADPYGVAIDPSGKFAYVANAYWGSSFGNISAYAIQRSGALMQVKGSPFAAGGGPVGLAIR